MAENLGDAVLYLRTDNTNFDEGLDQAHERARRVASGFARMGAGMTASLTVPLVFFGRRAMKMANEAEELQSAFNYSFGNMAEDMNKWAVSVGDGLQRSTQLIQEQAFTFNELFKSAADPAAAAALSQQFVRLTNDLSSFWDVTESDALTRLRSGLVGEAEPLRRFSVFLSAAAVESKALEMGLISLGDELTEEQKILARAQIILDKTTKAQGDLARTADSATNKERALGSAMQELGVKVGGLISEHLTPFIGHLTTVATRISQLNPEIIQTGLSIAAIAVVAGPVLLALGGLVSFVTALSAAMFALKPLLIAIALPLVKLAAVLSTVLVVWAKWEQITTWVKGVYDAVKTWILDKTQPIIDWFKGAISGIAEFFGTSSDALTQGAADAASKAADSLKQIGSGLIDFFTTAGDATITGLKETGAMALTVLDESWTTLTEHPVLTEGLEAIKAKFAALWQGVVADTKAGTAGVKGALDDMGQSGEATTKKSFGAQVKIAADAFTQIQGGLFTHSKKAFKISKALALAQALVALPSSVLETYKNNGGWPWGIIPAGIMLGIGLGEIQAIRSTTLGGGGSSSSGGGGGGGVSIPRSPAIDPVPVVSAEERNESTQRIVIEATDSEIVRTIADHVKIVADQEDVVLFGEDSRQGLGV